MKAVLQRVSEARVTVGAELVGRIGPGLLVFVCAERGDGDGQAEALARKIANLRVFADPAGKMNLSLRDVGGAVLLVSQFTLCADTRRGNRPSFGAAAPAERAEALCRHLRSRLAADGIATQTGRFGAHMAVQSVNDGPVTIWLDTGAG